MSNPTYEPIKKAFCEMKEIIQCFLSNKDTELLNSIEEFFSQYKNVYWDLLNINGELMKSIMYENMILHSMEYLICISDDHTYVEIDCEKEGLQ